MTDSAVGVEMLDIFDDMGRHLGVKPRDQVHLACLLYTSDAADE